MLLQNTNTDFQFKEYPEIMYLSKRKAWKNFVRVMACIVVFCTTYALILPAITMEKATFCGLEAHVHEEACYTQAASMVCDPTAGEDIIVLHTQNSCPVGQQHSVLPIGRTFHQLHQNIPEHIPFRLERVGSGFLCQIIAV